MGVAGGGWGRVGGRKILYLTLHSQSLSAMMMMK